MYLTFYRYTKQQNGSRMQNQIVLYLFNSLLTLFVTGGALNAPTIKNRSAISPWAMLGSPKLLTLFLLVLDIFQQSRFSKFQFLKKISNVVKNIQRGDPSVNFKFLVFWLEILFF